MRRNGHFRFFLNPLRSRNRWAIRGRNLAYFISSLLFVFASFLLQLVINLCKVLICGMSWFWPKSWRLTLKKEKSKKELEIISAIRAKEKKTTPIIKSQRDDVVAALRSLGCTVREAEQAAELARRNLGRDAKDEDLVKAALRSLAKR